MVKGSAGDGGYDPGSATFSFRLADAPVPANAIDCMHDNPTSTISYPLVTCWFGCGMCCFWPAYEALRYRMIRRRGGAWSLSPRDILRAFLCWTAWGESKAALSKRGGGGCRFAGQDSQQPSS
ncbi:hypothetical protein BS50DRAFT_109261 [Corynespora cassiicola Philippines]|uniref:Uncharacterized protein n=1 Tax=Corynespora cassiicola Philippines TaxID=1448308 RepID=A0A2T2ND42_CORCC|nr:hypothetical protein BS50DRAFT_109261 [Corynespora cassiicola Philippines]